MTSFVLLTPDVHSSQSLIVFLFGTVSHSLADMSWHALEGLEQGFIKVLAETSFDGDYTKGHTLADIGAEFVLRYGTSFFLYVFLKYEYD